MSSKKHGKKKLEDRTNVKAESSKAAKPAVINKETQTPAMQVYESRIPLQQQPYLSNHDPQKPIKPKLLTKIVGDEIFHDLLGQLIKVHTSTSHQIRPNDLPHPDPETLWRYLHTYKATGDIMMNYFIAALRITKKDWDSPDNDLYAFSTPLGLEEGPGRKGRVTDLYNERAWSTFMNETEAASRGLIVSNMDFRDSAKSSTMSSVSGAIYYFAKMDRRPMDYYCVYAAGLHTKSDDPFEGISGMLRSLILQLAKFAKADLDMSFSSPELLRRIEIESFDGLLRCFSSMIFALTRAGACSQQRRRLWILIDGLDQGEDGDGYMYKEDLQFVNTLRAHVFISQHYYGSTGISLKYVLIHPRKAFAKCTKKEQFLDIRIETPVNLPDRTNNDPGRAPRGLSKLEHRARKDELPGLDTLGDPERGLPRWQRS